MWWRQMEQQNGIVLLYPPRMKVKVPSIPSAEWNIGTQRLHTVCMLPIVQRQRISFIGDKWKPNSVNLVVFSQKSLLRHRYVST
jgi:hypothetical protein